MKYSAGHRAFSLVEVTLSLGVAAFCLIAVFGLLPAGLNSNKTSIEQTAATNLLTAIATDLRAAPNPPPGATAQSSAQFGIQIPAGSGSVTSGTIYVAEDWEVTHSSSGARYMVSLLITPPGSGSKQATVVHLRLTWPAAAPVTDAAGSVEGVVALNRN